MDAHENGGTRGAWWGGMKLVGLAVVSLVALANASPAHACSTTQCVQNAVLPSFGALPANMVKLLFQPGSARPDRPGDAGSAEPRLFRLEGTTKVSVPFARNERGWIGPIDAVPVGTQLVLEADAPDCPYSLGEPLEATYSVAEAEPLPTALGSLQATLARHVFTYATPPRDASNCGNASMDLAYADVRLELASEAQPYARLFAYQTYVDDQPYPRFTTGVVLPDYRPHGEERVAVVCRSESGRSVLSEGTHRVRFEGTLPDGTTVSTPEISIDLRCEGPAPAWPDGGAPRSVRDASAPDAGADEASADEASVDEASARPDAGDEGCALAASRSGWSGLLIALAALLRRRK